MSNKVDKHEAHKERTKLKELKKQYENLLDDIAIAKQSKNNLIAQNEALKEEIETETFNLDELEAAMNASTSLSQIGEGEPLDDENASKEPTFFDFLHMLENNEAVLKANIEISKKKLVEIRRNHNIQLQLKVNLEKELQNSVSALNIQQQEYQDVLNESNLITSQKIEIKDQNSELIEASNAIQNEIETKQAEIIKLQKIIDSENKNVLAPIQEEIKKLKDEIEKKEAKFQQRLVEQQTVIENTKKVLTHHESVSSWLAARSVMVDKIRKIKSDIIKKQTSIEKEQLAKEKLAKKFQELLGDEDPGDGTGKLAKMITKAEIDSFEKPKESSIETEFEIAVEKEAEAELATHLEQIENSINVFKKYRDSVMEALEQEYQQCSQGGYIALLQEERNNLKRKIQRI